MSRLLLITAVFLGFFIDAQEENQWILAQKLLPEGFPGSKGPAIVSAKQTPNQQTSFQPNMGQMASDINFVAKSNGYRMYVTSTDLVFDLLSQDEGHPGVIPGVITVKLLGANMILAGHGEDQRPGVSNYIYGGDESKWVYNVPTYSKVRYSEIYPGIDLLFYGNAERSMEHDFIISPGADYRNIKLAIQGAIKLEITKQGHINIEAIGGRQLRLKKPLAYQKTNIGTQFEIPSHYELDSENQISFWIDESKYNPNLDLVIDPVTTTYTTYLGGSSDDVVISSVVDSSGNLFVTGWTQSSNFPTASPYQGSTGGNTDVFVSKISSTGGLSISTYLGGNGIDVGTSIQVDNSGDVYVVGYSTSSNFPCYATTIKSQSFVAQVGDGSSTGAGTCTGLGGYDSFFVRFGTGLTYTSGVSTSGPGFLFGGTGFDVATGIVLDGVSCGTSEYPCPIIIGTTSSSSLSINDCGVTIPGCGIYPTYSGGNSDMLLVRNLPTENFLHRITYYGSSGDDIGTAIAIDSSANIYFTGSSTANDTTKFGNNWAGGRRDAFGIKLANYLADTAIAKTYLGGPGDDYPGGIGLYPLSSPTGIYVIGTSNGGPHSSGPFQVTNGNSYNSGKDIFITSLNSTMTSSNYMTFIGGSAEDSIPGIQSIAVDSLGKAWFVGQTAGTLSGVTEGSYPTGATSSGLYGYIASATSATTYNVFTYFGAANETDLLSTVTLKSGTDTTAYLGGRVSGSGISTVGTGVRGYSAAKDGIISVVQYAP